MKIDLHIHTQKCKDGDPDSRVIIPEKFVEQMVINNVGMCSITNHNKFDIKEFRAIKSINESLNIFPGIELDVKTESKHFHVILVADPSIDQLFFDTFDNDNRRDYESYYLEYDEFVNKVKEIPKDKIIVIPHFADKTRAIGSDFEDSPRKHLDDYVVILEPSKLQTMGMVNAHGHLSLIGSDVQDWKEYSRAELPVLKFKIDSFGKFYELCSQPETFIKQALSGSMKHSVPIHDNASLDIYSDINVIFGEKGSGKTVLLRDHLKPFFEGIGISTCFHKGSDYDQSYNKIITNLNEKVVLDTDILAETKVLMRKIINYREAKPNDFIKQYYSYHDDKEKSKNRKRLLKADETYINQELRDYETLLSNYSVDIKTIEKTKNINNELEREEHNKTLLNRELNLLISDLSIKLLNDCKSVFIADNIFKFLSNLKASADKNSNSHSKPSDIGFARLVAKRLQRFEENEKLIKKLNSFQRTQRQKLGYLSGKGIATFVTDVMVLNKNSVASTGGFSKNRIVQNREVIRKINEFDLSKFTDINSYFTDVEKDIDANVFCDDIIVKMSKIEVPGNSNYDPSEGEKAILSITGILESYDYQCYLFDEIERGLGNKFVTEYVIQKLDELRNAGKIIIISTHNANLAINTLPSTTVYCTYKNDDDEIYYSGNMYSNELRGLKYNQLIEWDDSALQHLEGNDEMFKRRKNIYGI
ncbi:hypothetical protein PT070_00720 [Erysipelothrix rhusiopathiae]|nr:hypothetical protein [Erysipelothrix rhusiopathiae]MDE8077800.1 hypothetical protein [Erysipelothrix rhusiopathiae]MDE8082897.1 hypothetical protein [Erysipelothrix rhusiopathiae]MDE8093210.1 hypothetical protein [Erysipelothrix rhusiopathiae]MDE8160706.1 hypothetical protein [Erysipelothrix rhusiopathiae]